MKSTILLLWVFRRRLFISMAIAFAGSYLLWLLLSVPSDILEMLLLANEGNSAVMVAMMTGAALARWQGMHGKLMRWDFPVTARQVAWTPMIAAFLIAGTSFAGILTARIQTTLQGQCIGTQWALFVTQASYAVPFWTFLLLMTLRESRRGGVASLFYFYIPVIPMQFQISDPLWFELLVRYYCRWWPAVALLCGFLILEGPLHIASLDRLNTTLKIPNMPMVNSLPDPLAPQRRHPVPIIGDIMSRLFGPAIYCAFIGAILLNLGSVRELAPHLMGPFGIPFGILFAIIAALLVFALVLSAWIVTLPSLRASGFGPRSSWGVGVLQLTYFLEPLARGLGLKRGVTMRCQECGGRMFVWAMHCPHCDAEAIDDKSGREAKEEFVAALQARTPQRTTLGTLVFLVVIFGFAYVGTGRDSLLQQTATLTLGGEDTAAAREEAYEEIGAALAKADLTTLAPSLPERYRIEATAATDGSGVAIAWYGPAWTENADLARILAAYVQEQTGLACEMEVDKPENDFASFLCFPPVLARTFLDNGIRWTPVRATGAAGDTAVPSWLTLPAWLTPPPPPGPTDRPVYVDCGNTEGWQNGKSWETAYPTIQQGINAAALRGIGGVWVAKGVYGEQREGEGALQMLRLVHLYGGFAGHETSRDERDWEANETIIDGSMARDGEPALHVVAGADYATLDGFTITGGRAGEEDVLGTDCGGGMYNKEASPTVAHCVFRDNAALNFGGGMFNLKCSPAITDCQFTRNEAKSGGGLMNFGECAPVITGCLFTLNRASSGGGMDDYKSSPILRNCYFGHNSLRGGESRCSQGNAYCTASESSPELTNCIFFANTGGEAFGCYKAVASLTHCTFSGNPDGAVDGGEDASLVILENCIVWGNSEEELRKNVSASHCLVLGGWPGEGNIDADPWFVDGASGNLRLLAQSPCIDSANPDAAPDADFVGVPRPQGAGPDMGAYESSFSLGKEKEAKRNQM